MLLSLEITLLTHSFSKMDSIEMLALSNPIASPLFFYNLFLKINAKLLNILTIIDFTAEVFIKVLNLKNVFILTRRICLHWWCLNKLTDFIALVDVLAQAIFHGDHALVVRIEIKCQLTEFMHAVFNELYFLR